MNLAPAGPLTIPNLACARCGAPELACIAPGDDGVRHDLLGPLSRPMPMRAWCSLACWDAQEVAA